MTPLTKSEWQLVLDLMIAFESVDSHAKACECEECEKRDTVLEHDEDTCEGLYVKAVNAVNGMNKTLAPETKLI